MDNRLKRIDVSRISPSGGIAGEGIVISEGGSGCEFGTVTSEGGGGDGGGGGGYTGFHEYSPAPDDGGYFIANFDNSFSSVNITGDILYFDVEKFTTGTSLLLKTTCPTGNRVAFNEDITFIGERPDVFPSGKTGMLVITSFGPITGTSPIIAGYAEQD
jgi:hypothetical protein